MTAFLIANMAPLMFGALVAFLLCGYPVAFALGANGLLFGLLGIELGLLHVELFQALPERVFGIMRNETLLAIPFVTFMGLILERIGMADRMHELAGNLALQQVPGAAVQAAGRVHLGTMQQTVGHRPACTADHPPDLTRVSPVHHHRAGA